MRTSRPPCRPRDSAPTTSWRSRSRSSACSCCCGTPRPRRRSRARTSACARPGPRRSWAARPPCSDCSARSRSPGRRRRACSSRARTAPGRSWSRARSTMRAGGGRTSLRRVRESAELPRVGGSGAIRVDVRVIAATNHDLPAAVAENAFREDLYFRLAVIPLAVPALRERAGDIPELVEHFLALLARETGRRAPSFTAGALEALARYEFPGNVRELKNLVERLVIMNPGARIGPEQVAAVLPAALPRPAGGE